MHEFNTWTLEAIREDEAMMSWLEEFRFEWSASVKLAVEQMIEGKTVVLITDHDRDWFKHYVLSALNKPNLDRPILPIVSIDSLHSHYDLITGGEKIDMLSDMLSMAYNDNYFFWYVGKGEDARSDIAKREDASFLWIMDEDFQNAFPLKSYDTLLDIKLLHLYRMFDKTLNAALFGDIDLNE